MTKRIEVKYLSVEYRARPLFGTLVWFPYSYDVDFNYFKDLHNV